MLIDTRDHLWLVKTTVPTPDHRSPGAEWIANWFLHLGIPSRS